MLMVVLIVSSMQVYMIMWRLMASCYKIYPLSYTNTKYSQSMPEYLSHPHHYSNLLYSLPQYQ